MGNILAFIIKYYSFIFFVLIVALAFLLYREHDLRIQEKENAEYIEQQKAQNFRAFKDSINVEFNKKLKALEFTKDNFVVQKLSELEAYNKTLADELKKVKGDVIAAINTNAQINLGGITTTGDKLSILDQKANYYGLNFDKDYSDEGLEQKITGTSKFHVNPDLLNKKWIITPEATVFDTLRTTLKITYGFKEIDNKYKVFAISKSDKVQLTDLTGGYIISKQPDSPAVPPKRFGIGPYIGYGVSAGTNLPARFGWGIGFSLHYDILQFNVPKIGK